MPLRMEVRKSVNFRITLVPQGRKDYNMLLLIAIIISSIFLVA